MVGKDTPRGGARGRWGVGGMGRWVIYVTEDWREWSDLVSFDDRGCT